MALMCGEVLERKKCCDFPPPTVLHKLEQIIARKIHHLISTETTVDYVQNILPADIRVQLATADIIQFLSLIFTMLLIRTRIFGYMRQWLIASRFK